MKMHECSWLGDPARGIYSKSILDIRASSGVQDDATDTLLKQRLQLPSLKVCHLRVGCRDYQEAYGVHDHPSGGTAAV